MIQRSRPRAENRTWRPILIVKESRALFLYNMRANRAFFLKRSKLTLYAEITNVLNRTHYRYADASIDVRTGRVSFERDTLVPFLPAAGVSVEF